MTLLKSKKAGQGFGILEVVITIAILGIISVVIIDIYIKSHNTFEIQKDKASLQTSTRSALDIISTWVKKSSSVVSVYTAPDNSVYITSAASLALKVPSIDTNGNTIAGAYDYVIFLPNQTDSNKLEEFIYSSTGSSRQNIEREICQNLKNIEIKYLDSNSSEITENYEASVLLKINLSSEEATHGETITAELNTQAMLRNK